MVMKCPRCGAENPDHATYCSLCLDMIGFEDPEMTSVETATDGYLTSYPSSFDPPVAQAGDPGWYSPGDAFSAQGQNPVNAVPPPGDMYVSSPVATPYTPPAPYQASGATPFSWGRAVILCAEIAAMAAFISIGLELLLSFVAINALSQGSFTVARIWLLLALLIPVCFAGFATGYRLQRYGGWATGLIAVSFWAFLFRPLYYALFDWLLYDRFVFAAIVSAENLIFTLCLLLPLGALMGWLGEKRATTGLQFR